jgi:hypothetical protein
VAGRRDRRLAGIEWLEGGRRPSIDNGPTRPASSIGGGNLRDRIGHNPALIGAGMPPEPACHFDRVGSGILPPGRFVADPVHQSVMNAVQRDDKFVARFAAERARLQVPQVVRVRRLDTVMLGKQFLADELVGESARFCAETGTPAPDLAQSVTASLGVVGVVNQLDRIRGARARLQSRLDPRRYVCSVGICRTPMARYLSSCMK